MSLVQSYTHLKDRPRADQALALLQRVASLVKPVMRKHGWKLPTLAEFFPENPALVGLNVNGGEKICLRLRPPHSPDRFYEEEQIVLVMLHELTHNVHGPHNQDFYNFLSGLEKEWDELKRTGYSGEGFHSDGRRLGVGTSHNIPPHQARLKALEAAEKRKRLGEMMASGGRLGGRRQNKTLRELAAEAAERRALDDKSCGSGVEARIEVERAAQQSVVHDATEVESNGPIEIVVPPRPPATSAERRQTGSPDGITVGPRLRNVAASSRYTYSAPPSAQSLAPTLAPGQWSCVACTFINEQLALQCLACTTQRPTPLTNGWTCLTCGEEGMEHTFWTCRYCGSVKADSSAASMR